MFRFFQNRKKSGPTTSSDVYQPQRRTSLQDHRDDAYRRLPRVVQPIVSLVCGVPPTGQEPWFVWTRPTIFACIALWALAGHAGGAFGGGLLLAGNPLGIPMCLASWLLTTGAFRATMTTILHDIVHGLESRCQTKSEDVTKYPSGQVGELLTVLLLLPSLKEYYKAHVCKHHNGRMFCTLGDPDAAFLWQLGFRAGMSKAELWKNFRRQLLSPSSTLYRLYTKSRLEGQVAGKSRWALVLVVWSVVGLFLYLTGTTTLFLFAYLVPSLIGIPAAALAQFTSEHSWLVVRKEALRQYLEKTCRGRLFMDPCPSEDLPFLARMRAWSIWWMRLLFVHLPTRIAVCPFDLGPGHDLHHYGDRALRNHSGCPSWATWMNAGYFRRWVEANRPEHALTTYYGLYGSIDAVFECYSQLDPDDPEQPQSSLESVEGMVWGM